MAEAALHPFGHRAALSPSDARPRLSVLLWTAHFFVYAILFGLVALPWTTPVNAGLMAILAALGATLGNWLGGRALRASAIAISAVLLWAMSLWISGLIRTYGSGVASMSLDGFSAANEFLVGAAWALPFATLMRFFGRRSAIGRGVELLVFGLILSSLFFAHRDGAIHRPHALVDPLITRGIDPTFAFVGAGALGLLFVIWTLLLENRSSRTLLHVAFLFVLSLVVAGALIWIGPPRVTIEQAADRMGLRDDTSQNGQGGGGGSGGSRQRPVPVAVVVLHDDYSPPLGAYYFRQGAWSDWVGGRFESALGTDVDQDLLRNFPTDRRLLPRQPTPMSDDRRSVEITVGLLTEHQEPFALEGLQWAEPAPNPNRQRFRQTYRAASAAIAVEPLDLMSYPLSSPTNQRELYLEGSSDPRLRAIGEQIVADIPEMYRQEPLARAVAITTWLGHVGTYSLRASEPENEADVLNFVTGDRVGFCVHFAHSAVYLMRAMGIPSRIGTGYLIPESARRGGSAILLSDQNAHAWPEVYLEGVGWVVVDVSPERTLEAPPAPPDPELQQLLAELLRGERWRTADEINPPPVRTWILAFLRVLVVLILVLIIGAIGAGYSYKIYRRYAYVFVRDVRSKSRLALRALLDRLHDRGLERYFGEDLLTYAARLRKDAVGHSDGPAQDPIARLVVIAERDRYVSSAPGPDHKHANVRQLLKQARSPSPSTLWKRFARTLNPFSWYATERPKRNTNQGTR